MANIHLKEEKKGDWSSVSELETFAIVRTAPPGLLGIGKADVLFLYKKKPSQKDEQQKKLYIYGEEDAVFERCLEVINRKKNIQKAQELGANFRREWKSSTYSGSSSVNIQSGKWSKEDSLKNVKSIDDIKKVNNEIQKYYYGRPYTLLGSKIQNSGWTAKSFAEQAGIKAPSLYHHVSGGREISRDVAIEYAEKLGCDPVDLMFEKKSIPVWSKCNLLKTTELEDYYRPGRLFSYAAEEKLERVVVPRDIYRPDIKAIKVEAKGSMYNNKVAFYYRATDKEQNILNQLCVVGVEAPIGPPELSNDTEERFYFGLYEENQGESNLLNPDPFAKIDNKYILKNFTPKFVSAIVLLLNPEAVVDQTKLKYSIPNEKLVRKEEDLKAQIEYYRNRAITHKEEVDELKKSEQSAKINQMIKELHLKQKEAEAEVKEILGKVEKITEKINREVQEKRKGFGLFPPLFPKEQEVLNNINKSLRIVTGGKK